MANIFDWICAVKLYHTELCDQLSSQVIGSLFCGEMGLNLIDGRQIGAVSMLAD